MLLRRLTPAAQLPLPLTLEHAKAHLKIEPEETAEDDLLTSVLIPAVAQLWEEYVKQPLMRANYLLLTSRLAGRLSVSASEIVAVEKVEYVSAAGELVEVEAARYSVGLYDPTTLAFSYPEGSPPTNGSQEAVRVRFSAGAASAAEVPPLRKQALLMLLAHFYENRQAVISGTIIHEVPLSARWLMELEREPTL